jgi:hypothetical protein
MGKGTRDDLRVAIENPGKTLLPEAWASVSHGGGHDGRFTMEKTQMPIRRSLKNRTS